MTKQEKVAAWLKSIGFRFIHTENVPPQYFRVAGATMPQIVISPTEATFFYDVTKAAELEAQIHILEKADQQANGSLYWIQMTLDGLRIDLSHLKQEGKTK